MLFRETPREALSSLPVLLPPRPMCSLPANGWLNPCQVCSVITSSEDKRGKPLCPTCCRKREAKAKKQPKEAASYLQSQRNNTKPLAVVVPSPPRRPAAAVRARPGRGSGRPQQATRQQHGVVAAGHSLRHESEREPATSTSPVADNDNDGVESISSVLAATSSLHIDAGYEAGRRVGRVFASRLAQVAAEVLALEDNASSSSLSTSSVASAGSAGSAGSARSSRRDYGDRRIEHETDNEDTGTRRARHFGWRDNYPKQRRSEAASEVEIDALPPWRRRRNSGDSQHHQQQDTPRRDGFFGRKQQHQQQQYESHQPSYKHAPRRSRLADIARTMPWLVDDPPLVSASYPPSGRHAGHLTQGPPVRGIHNW